MGKYILQMNYLNRCSPSMVLNFLSNVGKQDLFIGVHNRKFDLVLNFGKCFWYDFAKSP